MYLSHQTKYEVHVLASAVSEGVLRSVEAERIQIGCDNKPLASSEHFFAVSLGLALILSLQRLMNPGLFVGRSSTVPSFTTKSRVMVEFRCRCTWSFIVIPK